MEHIHVVPRPASPRHSPARHSTTREGVRLGLIIGVITWLWVAAFDYLRGEPFATVHFLGGFARFSIVHFALCLAYGLTIISALHASMKEPTIMFGIIFSAILFEAAFVILTAMLSNVGIGELAWGKFLTCNLIATAVTFFLIMRNHPLREMFDAAEALQKD